MATKTPHRSQTADLAEQIEAKFADGIGSYVVAIFGVAVIILLVVSIFL